MPKPTLPPNLLGTGELCPDYEAQLVAEGVVYAWWVVARAGNRILGTSPMPLDAAATQVLRTARQSLNGEAVRNMSCRPSRKSVPFQTPVTANGGG